MTIDTMREHFPDTKYVFETSGYTLDQIAEKTPGVLEKFKNAVDILLRRFLG